jgi:hypothetical protein
LTGVGLCIKHKLLKVQLITDVALQVMHLMLYSKLVWSGVKDLFDIFLHYLNIPFMIVRRRHVPRREEPAQGKCESGENQNSIESRFG